MVNKITSAITPNETADKINEIIDNLGGSVDIDNKSITTNSDDELQTVGVIDNNNTTNAIKTWTGTKAQYDAIVTKDANTLYNITDDDTSLGDIVTDLNNKADTDLTNCTVPVVISRTSNNQGGIVEIWSDGYCIQTGIATVGYGGISITLDESYKDNNFKVFGNVINSGDNNIGGGPVSFKPTSINTFTARLYTYISDSGSWNSGYSRDINYETKGYIR